MREEIRALQRKLGVTVIYVTHDQSEALAVSDRIVVMRNAEIAQAGAPRELYERPSNVFVATFMGDANHVKGTLEPTSADRGVVTLAGIQMELRHPSLPGGEVDVVARPEAIHIGERDENSAQVPARVRTATYMGSHVEYILETPLGDLFAVSGNLLHARSAGEEVSVRFDESGTFVVRP